MLTITNLQNQNQMLFNNSSNLRIINNQLLKYVGLFLCHQIEQSDDTIINAMLQQMRKDNQQLDLEYKIVAPISTKQRSAANSKVTLQNFQTPAWSSILQQEQNSSINQAKTKVDHNSILQKLNQMKEVDLAHSTFAKVRVPEGFESSRVRVLEKKLQNNVTPIRQKQKGKDNLQSTIKQNEKQYSSHRKCSRLATGTSLRTSNISTRPIRSGSIVKNMPAPNKSVKEIKRFNQITVHQHLYLDGRRMKAKRVMQQMLEEQFRRKYIMPFKPMISAASQQLAEDRFNRVRERQQIERSLEHQINKIFTISNKVNKDQVKEKRSENRYKMLNRLFYYLSNTEQLIRKQTMKERIEELPLVCIKLLQKFIQSVYAGHRYSWLQFVGVVNDRKTIANKQGLLAIFQKWEDRLHKRQIDNSTKENTRPCC